MNESEKKKTQSKSNPPKVDMSGWDFGWMNDAKKITDKFGNVIGFIKEESDG